MRRKELKSEEPSSSSSFSSKESTSCYLIRVPKSINVKELAHYQVDLAECGLSNSVVSSKSDPERSFGYSLLAPGTANAAQLTLLRGEDKGDDEDTSLTVDSTFHLAGCINFYAYRIMPDNKATPLLVTSPNEPIEVIINRARGHSIKRKQKPQSQPSEAVFTTTIEDVSDGKRRKRK